MMDLGRHAVFIWSSYGVVAVVLAALIAWLLFEGRQLRRQLADFEARGITRRSRRAQHAGRSAAAAGGGGTDGAGVAGSPAAEDSKTMNADARDADTKDWAAP